MTSPSALQAFLDTSPDPVPPPPGIEANFNAPNTNGTAYIIIAVIGIFLATVFTVVRVYTKGILTRSLGWDDLASILTLVFAIIWTALNIKLVGLGMGVQIWNYNRTYRSLEVYSMVSFESLSTFFFRFIISTTDPYLPALYVQYRLYIIANFSLYTIGLPHVYKTALAANSSYFITICLVKVTILMLYLRTFAESKRFRYIIYAVLSILAITHLVTLIIYLAAISPLHCYWTYYSTEEEWYSNCSENYNSLPSTVFIAVATIVLDIVILALPCPAVWRLHVAKRQKIAILLLLVAGIVVTIASVLRLVYLLHRFYFDSEFTNSFYTEFQVNTISTIEIDVAIICACLPTLKAFLKRFVPKILGSSITKPSAYAYKNSTLAAQLPSSNHNLDRKWQSDSHEERLTAPYLELDEDGKSNKSYAMEPIQPQSA